MFVSKIQIFLLLSILIDINSIHSVPDLSKTSNKFNTFSIDFRGIDTPPATYWSLANFHLDTTDFEKTHKDVSGGGAYAGLQTLSDGSKVAIFSLWKISYKENDETKYLYANRIYPPGEEMKFSGEGEGSTFRGTYNWETNVWHRFVLHTWEDEETKKTFVGIWIQNVSTNTWTLFAYFNSNLSNSYIGGGWGALAMFQEIFNSKFSQYERSFNLKNMYVFDRTNNNWASINTTEMRYAEQKDISYEIGFTSSYFYGYSGPKIEEKVINNKFTGSITQPSKPDTKGVRITGFNFLLTSNRIRVKWENNPNCDPAFRYSITIDYYTSSGYKTIHQKVITRPEVTMYTYTGTFKGTYRAYITQTSIFRTYSTTYMDKIV